MTVEPKRPSRSVPVRRSAGSEPLRMVALHWAVNGFSRDSRSCLVAALGAADPVGRKSQRGKQARWSSRSEEGEVGIPWRHRKTLSVPGTPDPASPWRPAMWGEWGRTTNPASQPDVLPSEPPREHSGRCRHRGAATHHGSAISKSLQIFRTIGSLISACLGTAESWPELGLRQIECRDPSRASSQP